MAGDAGGAAGSVGLAAAGELLARAVGAGASRQVAAAVAAALWRCVMHPAASCDAEDPEAGRQVAARLAAIKPCLAAQELAAGTLGAVCHTARGLVSRNVQVRANAARHHGFGGDFSKLSAADCRRAQRGAGRQATPAAATAVAAAPATVESTTLAGWQACSRASGLRAACRKRWVQQVLDEQAMEETNMEEATEKPEVPAEKVAENAPMASPSSMLCRNVSVKDAAAAVAVEEKPEEHAGGDLAEVPLFPEWGSGRRSSVEVGLTAGSEGSDKHLGEFDIGPGCGTDLEVEQELLEVGGPLKSESYLMAAAAAPMVAARAAAGRWADEEDSPLGSSIGGFDGGGYRLGDGISFEAVEDDVWPPEAEWPQWWSQLPKVGFGGIQLLWATDAPYLATVRFIEGIEGIGEQRSDMQRLPAVLAEFAPAFQFLVTIIGGWRRRLI